MKTLTKKMESMQSEKRKRERLMSLYGIDEKDIVREKDECEAAKYNWEWFDRIAGYLESQKYIFAKTLKKNPHYYTLRKLWREDSHFEDTVTYMRMVGYTEYFYGKKYNMFNVNENKYWTMWERINKDGRPWTILINRKHIDKAGTSHYDYISGMYDNYTLTEQKFHETEEVMERIAYKRGERILDIGCGTGSLLDVASDDIDIEGYVGIDKSNGMLNELYKKHGFVDARNCTFEDFFSAEKFDKVVSLFGSFSYISPRYLGKVEHYLNCGGKALLMFYSTDYHPSLYAKTSIEIPYYMFRRSVFDETEWKITQLGDYMVAEYEKA